MNWLILVFNNGSKHYEVDWSPYYNQMFRTILRLVTDIFPKKVKSHVQNYLEINNKYCNFYPTADDIPYSALLLVELMRPQTFAYTEQCTLTSSFS